VIGANLEAILQSRSFTKTSDIGTRTALWEDVAALAGWLDFASGGNVQVASKTLEESTHIFICKWLELPSFGAGELRLLIGDVAYEVIYIDDPMGLHRQIEIYLRYGGDKRGNNI
jgi:hypothetical protein